ncbi:MAG TPA: hypothetical protein VMB84_13450 [Stellaceae bacterium]|nr:hypothetical protein [Stellaceae bacterium]
MWRGIISGLIAFAAICVVAYPVAQELFARAIVEREMINNLDVNDAAALKQWPGSVASFVAMLHERCMSIHGRDSAACTRYRLLAN